MPEDRLERRQITGPLEELGCEAVPEVVAAEGKSAFWATRAKPLAKVV